MQAPFPLCKIICPGVKSERRARQKALKYKWAGDNSFRRLRDYARMGFIMDTISDVLQCVDAFKTKFGRDRVIQVRWW